MENNLNDNNGNNGSFRGLIPLLCFLVVYFAMGVGTGDFGNFPLAIGLFLATYISFFMKKKGGDTATFSEKVDIFCRGGGDQTLILMVLIYLLAGAFYSVAGAMHATDSATNLMLSIIPARLVLPGLFFIGSVISFSMGTSMGTVSAVAPIAIALAPRLDVSLALMGGIVIGGAMFGDNLSFISDTTIAATTTQGIKMKDKFKANILMVLPAWIITMVILSFVPINVQAVSEGGDWNFVNLLPYICIIALSLAGLHVALAMGISVLLGTVIGIIHGDFAWVESFNIIHEGMTWMEDMAILAVLVGGIIGLMKYLGGVDWLLSTIGKRAKSRVGGELSIAALATVVDLATTNNTMTIIACGPLGREISAKFGIQGPRTASILDLFASAAQGIIPYGGQLLAFGGLAAISPVAITPYCWYSFLMFVFGVVFIILGYPKKFSSDGAAPVATEAE